MLDDASIVTGKRVSKWMQRWDDDEMGVAWSCVVFSIITFHSPWLDSKSLRRFRLYLSPPTAAAVVEAALERPISDPKFDLINDVHTDQTIVLIGASRKRGFAAITRIASWITRPCCCRHRRHGLDIVAADCRKSAANSSLHWSNTNCAIDWRFSPTKQVVVAAV